MSAHPKTISSPSRIPRPVEGWKRESSALIRKPPEEKLPSRIPQPQPSHSQHQNKSEVANFEITNSSVEISNAENPDVENPDVENSEVENDEPQDSLNSGSFDLEDDEEDSDDTTSDWYPDSEEDMLAALDKESTDEDGQDTELHVYENHVNSQGQEIALRVSTNSALNPPKNKSHRACLVLVRTYNRNRDLTKTILWVQSPHLVECFRRVIGNYGGLHFKSRIINIEHPPHCIFHFQDQLRRDAEMSSNEALKAHMRLCLQYVQKTMHEEVRTFQRIMSSESPPDLEFFDIWMVFKPGSLVYEKTRDGECLSIFRGIIRSTHALYSPEERPWTILTERIHFAEVGVGLVTHRIEIEHYEGRRSIAELSAVPLRFHPEANRIRGQLLKRGRKFLSLCGIKYQFYDGPALMCSGTGASPMEKNMRRANVKHRIMIDINQYCRQATRPFAEVFVLGSKVRSVEGNDKHPVDRPFSDEEIMTCFHSLPGYSMEKKQWGLFRVDNIKNVPYNRGAFDGLVLPVEKKRLISSLVRQSAREDHDGFDDQIQGKGKGLTFLLHGPPGVGKTYTAESIADHTLRPLLKINAGELQGPSYWVEERLNSMFELAVRWNCVLLMDEADVFMQQRTLEGLERNWLVSILLRVLEYYEGILFLTTNRAETIDTAFKSRIHLSIAYPPLSVAARRTLWEASITRAHRGQVPPWLTDEFAQKLAAADVNGREVKNIVRTAQSLARNEDRDISSENILLALDAMKQFDADFSQRSKGKGRTVN